MASWHSVSAQPTSRKKHHGKEYGKDVYFVVGSNQRKRTEGAEKISVTNYSTQSYTSMTLSEV